MKHRLLFVLMLLVSIMLSTGVSVAAPQQQAEGGTRQVEADNGTIEVPADPQRVATIGNTTLPFIDLGGIPVAVTAESDSDVARLPEDQQATYAAATILAASADEVDMEQLASLQPDLILVQIPDAEFEQIKPQLEAIAPTVFWGLDTEWKELADGIAEAGNLTETLGEQKAALEDKVTNIQETYSAIIDDTSFVDISRGTWNDPGTFYIADIGCSEIARDDIGLNFPEAAEGEDPLAYTALSFEQLSELSEYDVILYPVDAEGQPTEPFVPVVETNTWQALPQVTSGQALGVFCPGNNSYGAVLRYLDSLDSALAALPGADDSSSSAENGTRQVEADNGTIEVPADPQRVATIGNTTLPFIDLGGEPIGVMAESDSALALLPEDQQATYAAATNFATSADEVDLELLASLQPDLIVVQIPDAEFEQIKPQLEAIAPTVFWGLDTEWKELADGIAEAGNLTDTLSEQKAALEDKVTNIQETYSAIIEDTSFVDILRGTWSDPGTFIIADIGCSEIARDDIGLNLPEAAEGEDPLAYTSLSFEQLSELSEYDVILYPLDIEGQPIEPFLPVIETNTWQALPQVTSGHALGVFCPGNNSYGAVLRYLDSLDSALAALPAQ
jgi:iron complex transport system substrate-binding protein